MRRFLHLFGLATKRELDEHIAKERALEERVDELTDKVCFLTKDSMDKQSLIVDLETSLMVKSAYRNSSYLEDFEDYYDDIED